MLLVPASVSAQVDVGGHFTVDVRDLGGDDELTLRAQSLIDVITEVREPSARISAAAALRAYVRQGQSGIQLVDESSFLRVAWRPHAWNDDGHVSATVFPLSSRALHAGFLDPIAWRREFPGQETGSVPGVRLKVSRQRWAVWTAIKTATAFNEDLKEGNQRYAMLAGGRVEVIDVLRVEASGAWGPELLVPAFAVQGIRTPIHSHGITGRVTYHRGEEVRLIRDLDLFGADPYFYDQLLAPQRGVSHGSHQVSVEVTHLRQELGGLGTAGRTVDTGAWAAAVDARVRLGSASLNALATLRDVYFIQRDLPGLPP